jgi:hypothetical protein
MLTRAIFKRPDGELIRESICACANLLNCLLIEEHMLKLNRGSTNTLKDSIRKDKIRFDRKEILNYAYRIRVEKWSRSV